jgi:hypothetical protein
VSTVFLLEARAEERKGEEREDKEQRRGIIG